MPFERGTSIAHASPLEKIDGIYFWHGDMNYPISDISGNKFCSGLDLSSAYVANDDADELIISVTSIHFSYLEDTAVDYGKATFKEDRHTGKAYLCFENSPYCLSTDRQKTLNDTYYYLKCYLQVQ
jgi:hypothetical protein